MNSDKNSNVLIFITGHGGDEFFKFQDFDEINSDEFASVFSKMHERGRYKQILLFFDTCQASTMIDKIRAPNIYAVSSSKLGESSYSVILNVFFCNFLILIFFAGHARQVCWIATC